MKLSRINNLLLALIIAVNLYIIAAPLLPAVAFWWHNRGGSQQSQLQAAIRPSASDNNTRPTKQPNGIIIPSMLLNKPILEGSIANQYRTLDKGIWRWPDGSTPDHAGNTVLIGHRFTYTQPEGVLYYLNKVKIGDEIGVIWSNKHYLYKVSNISVVPPTDTSIENATADSRLTIFTCTPLWWPKDRLVVVAKQEQL